MSRIQRFELLLFVACFFAFAYFNQGGGWNQNARFAEVRAIVEQGRFPIDDFLVFRRNSQGDDLVRMPVDNAEYTLGEQRYRLSWVDMDWNLYPVGDRPLEPGVEKAPMVEVCATGDVSYVPKTGHFHPNKPPGTSLLAVPGYFVIYHVERLLGINPDHWWTMNINVWLTTVCSVGFISALGCVVFFRLARVFSEGAMLPALFATITFAFGTTFFPFATILFDHSLTASLLIGSFYFLWKARNAVESGGATERAADVAHILAGLCAGLAAVTNYIAAVPGAFLGLYALLAVAPARWNWRGAIFFSVGVLGPFLLICWYGWVCFGSPFKLNNDFQNPLFKDGGNAFLGMFGMPNGYVTLLLLFSPFRGIFFLSPILILGVVAAVIWLMKRRFVPEIRLCVAIFAFFFLVNASFNGFHAGFSAGPRYLVPGIPFLALPLVTAFARWRWTASLLATVSVVNHLLLTATDGQNPTGVGGHARMEGRRQEWDYHLVKDYAWPLFAHGRAWPLLEEQMIVHMDKEQDRIEGEIKDPKAQGEAIEALTAQLRASIQRGESSPFLLASIIGPVSVNPIGVYEGLFTYGFFPPGSPQCRWASFNIGELLPSSRFWAQSRSSLLPLLFATGGLCCWLVGAARRIDRESLKKIHPQLEVGAMDH